MKTLPALIAALLLSGAALLLGQVPPDVRLAIFEAGNEVGQVYRAPGYADASVYTEHWILYPGYVYPGPRTLAVLNLVPKAAAPYRSEEDFFANASFPKGSKYVRVTAEEFNYLPAVQR